MYQQIRLFSKKFLYKLFLIILNPIPSIYLLSGQLSFFWDGLNAFISHYFGLEIKLLEEVRMKILGNP